MNYGPHRKTFKGDKNRIKDNYYWLDEKNNSYKLRFWDGKQLRNKETDKLYYEKNKDKIKQKTKLYYEKNKEQISDKTKIYYEKNKEQISDKTKIYYKKNKEKISEMGLQYRKDNKEKISEMGLQYRKDNKEKLKEYRKQYRKKNKDKIKTRVKLYYEKNKEKIEQKKGEYYEKNKEKISSYQKQYRKDNKEKINKCCRIRKQERRDKETQYRLVGNMRHRLHGALKAQKAKKNKRSMEYFACTVEHFYTYIESLFTDEMSWDNQGKKAEDKRGWQLDHRRPCASFDFNNEEEIYMCFHWSNYQPLWAEDNNKKSDIYDSNTFEYEWKGREIGWVKL